MIRGFNLRVECYSKIFYNIQIYCQRVFFFLLFNYEKVVGVFFLVTWIPNWILNSFKSPLDECRQLYALFLLHGIIDKIRINSLKKNQ